MPPSNRTEYQKDWNIKNPTYKKDWRDSLKKEPMTYKCHTCLKPTLGALTCSKTCGVKYKIRLEREELMKQLKGAFILGDNAGQGEVL